MALWVGDWFWFREMADELVNDLEKGVPTTATEVLQDRADIRAT